MRIRILFYLIVTSLGLNTIGQSDNKYIALVYNPKISYFSSSNSNYKDNRSPLLKNDIGFKLYLSKYGKVKFVTGLIYTNKGWKDKYEDATVKRNYSYLDIPLMMDFRLMKVGRLSFNLPVGLVPEILVDYDKKSISDDKKYDIDSKYIGYWDNTSFHLGLRLNYNLTGNFYLMIEPNLNYQVIKQELRRQYDCGIEFSIGYEF